MLIYAWFNTLIYNLLAIAPKPPATREYYSYPSIPSTSRTPPIPQIAPRFPSSHSSIAQKAIQDAQRRDREAKEQQLQAYQERMQMMKQKEEAMLQDLRAFQRHQQELSNRMQQLRTKLDNTVTISPPDVMGECDDISSYSNNRVPRNSTPVVQADKLKHERLSERSFRPITHTDDRPTPIPQQTTLHIPNIGSIPQISHITYTEKRQLTPNANDSTNKRQKKAETTGTITPPHEWLNEETTDSELPPIHRPEFSLPPFNGEALQFKAFITNFTLYSPQPTTHFHRQNTVHTDVLS